MSLPEVRQLSCSLLCVSELRGGAGLAGVSVFLNFYTLAKRNSVRAYNCLYQGPLSLAPDLFEIPDALHLSPPALLPSLRG